MVKIIISKYSKDFVRSFNSTITFSKISEYLVSFELTKKDWKKLFSETIKSGNNPFELYSWDKNILSHFYS
jgi:hypothetical protein